MANSHLRSMTQQFSYLDLINLCDNVHVPINGQAPAHATGFDAERLVPLYLTDSIESAIVGLLRPVMIEQLKIENERSRRLGREELWDIRVEEDQYRLLKSGRVGPSVNFARWCGTPGKRTEAMRELCERWRDEGLFADVCGPGKWRNEMYAVYADPFGRHDHPNEGGDEGEMNFVFEMERSACALFGVVTYGVHMSIYGEGVDGEGRRELRVWVPTRAKTKQTFPGLLDNTVAGGIASGMGVFESLTKECMEEASLEAEVVKKYARAAGAVSYFYRTSKGWLQPEIEYVYDIAMPGDVDGRMFAPSPLDGEVESFELMKQDRLIERLRAGAFKPNCGLVLIDLFVRLGYIVPDEEPDYMEIESRLHGRFRYDVW